MVLKWKVDVDECCNLLHTNSVLAVMDEEICTGDVRGVLVGYLREGLFGKF